MSQCSNDTRVSDLFTRGSHHRGISVFFLTQNLFPPGKLSRTISLNSHYMIVFRNPRDSLGISTLAKQMFPHRVNYLLDSFRDATSKPYGYLLIDCHQLTPENMRLRTNILPGERQIVYVKTYLKTVTPSQVVIYTMSKRMKDNLPYLQALVKCRPKVRKLLIEHGPTDLITSICECSLNVLKGVIPLTLSQKRRLARYKTHLHAF